jgi:asparagine synthase (glutamine-hydrolysing)
MEKALLREVFSDDNILPEKVLWRRKEAFSDGISKAETSWFEMAKAEGLKQAGGDWETKARAYTVNTPKTPEAYWYRKLFHTWYVPHTAVVPAMWMPRFMDGASDPSARTLGLYKA